MITENLSRKNARYTKSVTDSAGIVYPFTYYGIVETVNFMCNRRFHAITLPDGNLEAISINGMDQYRVSETSYNPLLNEFWDIAKRSASGTSFSPDERGERIIKDYESQLIEDISELPEDAKERYIEGYKKYFSAWLYAKSRCLSTMITGPANFNTRRNDKCNSSEDKRYTEFQEWRVKASNAIKKKAETDYQNSLTDEQKTENKWSELKKIIDDVYIPMNLYLKLERIAMHGEVALMQKAIDYVREWNTRRKRPLFTERHKFFRLVELAEKYQQKLNVSQNAESTKIEFEGGHVLKNFAEDRVQIIHDTKPEPDVITNLKRNGFRWSPRSGAWQRQLTFNGICATERLLNIKLSK